MVMVTLKLQRYIVIYKRSPLNMQKIKKSRSPSRQLLETVNFAFIKIFDFLVKIALFRVSLLFLWRHLWMVQRCNVLVSTLTSENWGLRIWTQCRFKSQPLLTAKAVHRPQSHLSLITCKSMYSDVNCPMIALRGQPAGSRASVVLNYSPYVVLGSGPA